MFPNLGIEGVQTWKSFFPGHVRDNLAGVHGIKFAQSFISFSQRTETPEIISEGRHIGECGGYTYANEHGDRPMSQEIFERKGSEP